MHLHYRGMNGFNKYDCTTTNQMNMNKCCTCTNLKFVSVTQEEQKNYGTYQDAASEMTLSVEKLKVKRQTKSLSDMHQEASNVVRVKKSDQISTVAVDSRLFSSTPEIQDQEDGFELESCGPESSKKSNFRKKQRVLSRSSSKYSVTSQSSKKRSSVLGEPNPLDSTAVDDSERYRKSSVSTINGEIISVPVGGKGDLLEADSDLEDDVEIDGISFESSISDLKHRKNWTRSCFLEGEKGGDYSRISRPSSRAEEKKECRKQLRLNKMREKQRVERESMTSSNDALQKAVTALYANVLVILGFALPLSEVISANIEEDFFQLFYVYLYLGSVLFLLFIYIDRLQSRTRKAVFHLRSRSKKSLSRKRPDSTNSSRDTIKQQLSGSQSGINETESGARLFLGGEDGVQAAYGSFYLRLGTVLFGIGSLIYTGIEVGGIFEVGMMTRGADCKDFISVVRPGLQIIFIFSQMYFIFLNQKMNVYKRKLVGRFGLMHMIATNLCVWLKVLILETKHEIDISHFRSVQQTPIHEESTNMSSNHSLGEFTVFDVNLEHYHYEEGSGYEDDHTTQIPDHVAHPRDHHGAGTCHNKIMYKLLEDSSPFLFPCTIEFSLICAAVLFIMWKNVSIEHDQFKQEKMRRVIQEKEADCTQQTLQSRRHQMYSVDCSHANTGLFCGIVVVVVTIISLIIFFVFISNENSSIRHIAVQVASVTELTLYSLTTLAVLIGLCQMRRLWYDVTRKLELDNLLLVIAQTGVFIYAAFSIIGTFFQLEKHLIAFLASLATLVQTTLQTIFILDASCRFAYTSLQVREKPGREIVTFLLVCNLAMWLLNTLETNRADSHPIQVEFYGGAWAWPMITHISMPLAIFYRFHSTVCLFEIWKKSFKYKPSHINYV